MMATREKQTTSTAGVLSALCSLLIGLSLVQGLFVDKSDPYKAGPLKVGQLTLAKTLQGAPLHTIVFFPLEPGDYPPIFFVPGWRGEIPAEVYEDLQTRVASHGFVVFGVDPKFPVLRDDARSYDVTGSDAVGAVDVKTLFTHLDWLRGYMMGRTEARVAWNSTVLMCHSAGCDCTLQMIQHNSTVAKASVFLEPYSLYAKKPMSVKVPVLSYGTELSETGKPACARAGEDWRQFYKVFSCPKILMEVKGFGHCDILDPEAWQVCHDIHFCATTNNSRNLEYRQFLQGVVSAFLIGTIEGYAGTLDYILNRTLVPLELLDLQSDVGCL